jgi:hypothetical protein
VVAWRYLDGSGHTVGTSEEFGDVKAAEAWLSEAWSDLRDDGIDQVELVDQHSDEVLYRMGLSEADA